MARPFRRFSSLLVIASLLGGFLLLTPASSHDPVTTTVTFNKEIVRILQKNCAGCHAPGQIKADIPLTTFDEARPWAKAIKEEVLEKRMPPFQAVKGFGDFSNDYLLSQREVELLVSWIEGGAPKGDPADYPKAGTEAGANDQWAIGKPDLILKGAVPTEIPAGEGDFQVDVRIKPNLESAKWISDIEFKPSNGTQVKRAEFFAVDKCVGKTCPSPTLAGKLLEWVPGQAPLRLRPQFGITLKPGSEILARIVYLRSENPAKDQSRLGLIFSREMAGSVVERVPVSVSGVPAAEGKETRIVAYTKFDKDKELLGIRPLLFPLSRSVEVTVYRPDGSIEIAGAARNYNTGWEPTYFFKKPIRVPSGSRIEAVSYILNSDDNRNLNAPVKGLIVRGNLAELVVAEKLSR